MITYRGVGGASGIAIGRAIRFVARPASSSGSFATRRERALAYLHALAQRLRGANLSDEAAIFDGQALLLTDPALERAVAAHEAAGLATTAAITAAVNELAAPFAALEDARLRERAADVHAVGSVLLDGGHSLCLPPGAIVVAADLTPADTVNLPLQQLGGIVTAAGSPTSHTAILARALRIPAVLGLGEVVLSVEDETRLVLDGDAALLIVDPDEATLQHYLGLQAARAEDLVHGPSSPGPPAETTDGRRIALWANIGSPAEVDAAIAAGAEGIGLFRTEFLFFGADAPPSEDEQCGVYRDVLERMAGRPVVVRTLDAGGDKPLPYLQPWHEPNPMLGQRGIRCSRRFPDLFRAQLRALLRAGTRGDLRIMLPMIATLDDLHWARMELKEVAAALRSDGIPHRPDVPLGVMIETPAAAIVADQLARTAAFFSIGSNDLAQYALAADRMLPDLALQYNSADPAVFRLITLATNAAHAAGIAVAVCGELAADPAAAEAMLGLGVNELSMAPSAIPAVKARIRGTTSAAARAAAARACAR